MPKTHFLRDAYRYPGFVPATTVRVELAQPDDYTIPLTRHKKTVCYLGAFRLADFCEPGCVSTRSIRRE